MKVQTSTYTYGLTWNVI